MRLVSLASALVALLPVLALARALPQKPAGKVQVWLTTKDGKHLLAPQKAARWGAASKKRHGTVIAVNDRKRYQTITGFGASITDSSATVLMALPQATRDQVMTELFSPTKGIGISFLRQPMGASDFSSIGNYSYDDMPAGQTDPTLAHFSIAHDQVAIIPLLKQALSLNPDLKIVATPWSPPGWMKTSDSMIGGTLRPEAYAPLAQYFVKFVQAYTAAGVPIYAVTPQNEPQYSPSGYPGMLMSAGEQARFIGQYLGPAFKAAGLTTKILTYDHNWGDQNGGVATYPSAVLGDTTAAPYIGGVAFHCYSGGPEVMSQFHKDFPTMPIYQTECSGGDWQGDFSQSLKSELVGYIINGLRNWASSAILWNLALDTHAGPQNGGCSDCRGIVTVDTDAGTATRTSDYAAVGHVSAFVRPGAVRVASNSFGPGGVDDVAFVNPDGSHVLVAYNDAFGSKTITVRWKGKELRYRLPEGAAATFVWK